MLGFIIAVIAGFLVPYLEQPVARPLARALAPWLRIEETEIRMVAFAIMALLTAILAQAFASGRPIWLVIGLILGVFILRIVEAVRKAVEQRQPR